MILSLAFKMGLIFILSAIWGELSGIRNALEKKSKGGAE